MKDLPIVRVPHPIGSLQPEQVTKIADGIVQRVIDSLTTPIPQLTTQAG
ncbi:MAG: hypothetical protein HYX89_07100 [Chloroflexi bacterium]|nr:hypothetical protein [Chloroflexota bacterium]